MRYASAPSSLPPMYTGLPLIPSTTPVYSGLVPCSRTRIMSCRGPRAPRSTPKISTSIGSGLLPSKTVHAVPVIPRWTLLNGNTPAVEGGGPLAAPLCALSATEPASPASSRPAATIRGINLIANPESQPQNPVSISQVLTSIRVQPQAVGPEPPSTSGKEASTTRLQGAKIIPEKKELRS